MDAITRAGSPVRPYSELINLLNDADHGIEGLLDLLHKANSPVHSEHIYRLLKPMHELLRAASNDLNDMDPS